MTTTIQPMPDLTGDQLDALRADIEAHGVRVPVVKDQHGRILDGNNRAAIADQLGIDYPVEVVQVADDDEAHDIAVSLNCARRHLTREQVRELIITEHERRPDDSDRAIARRVGCSPSTVAAALRPVSNLDTYAKPEDVDEHLKMVVLDQYEHTNFAAELPKDDAADRWCRGALLQDADDTFALGILLASDTDSLDICVSVIGRMAMWKSRGIDRGRLRHLFEPWLDRVLSPSVRENYRSDEFYGRLGECVDGELREELLRNVGSVPLMPAGGGGR